jgi:hypothetical protein
VVIRIHHSQSLNRPAERHVHVNKLTKPPPKACDVASPRENMLQMSASEGGQMSIESGKTAFPLSPSMTFPGKSSSVRSVGWIPGDDSSSFDSLSLALSRIEEPV